LLNLHNARKVSITKSWAVQMEKKILIGRLTISK
jgi:hypothetical protein